MTTHKALIEPVSFDQGSARHGDIAQQNTLSKRGAEPIKCPPKGALQLSLGPDGRAGGLERP